MLAAKNMLDGAWGIARTTSSPLVLSCFGALLSFLARSSCFLMARLTWFNCLVLVFVILLWFDKAIGIAYLCKLAGFLLDTHFEGE